MHLAAAGGFAVVAQGQGERLASPVHAGQDGAARRAGYGGDLRGGEAADVHQGDSDALGVGQGPQRGRDLAAADPFADNGKPTTASEPAASGETSAAPGTESQPEKLLGINPEATGLVIIAVALSLLLAALTLTVGSPLVPAAVAAAMLAFTVLDVREVTHQLTESRPGLAALAATVALLHLLTAVSALLVARTARSQAG